MAQVHQARNGQLTTTQVVLYRCPENRQGVVVSLRFVNTGGAAHDVTCYLKRRGDTARVLVLIQLATGLTTTNSWSLDRPFLVEPGTTIEAAQAAGAAVDWNLSVLETPLP